MIAAANILSFAVLADARLEHLHAIRQHWGDLLVPLGWAGAIAAVAGVMLGAVALHRWLRNRAGTPRPIGVFRRLAGGVGLTLREQWLLMRIARRQALPSPLTLLVSRRTLRVHARRYAAELSAGRRLSVMMRVRALRSRLMEPSA